MHWGRRDACTTNQDTTGIPNPGRDHAVPRRRVRRMIGQLQRCQRGRLARQIRRANRRALRPHFIQFSHAASSLKGQPSIFAHDFAGIIQPPPDQPRCVGPQQVGDWRSTLMSRPPHGVGNAEAPDCEVHVMHGTSRSGSRHRTNCQASRASWLEWDENQGPCRARNRPRPQQLRTMTAIALTSIYIDANLST